MKKIQKYKMNIWLLVFTFISPALIFADDLDFKGLTKNFYDGLLTQIINLMFVLVIVFFAWSIFRYIAIESDKKDKAKDTLVWGLIAVFVVFSFWGILKIFNKTFFTENDLNGGNNFSTEFMSEYDNY